MTRLLRSTANGGWTRGAALWLLLGLLLSAAPRVHAINAQAGTSGAPFLKLGAGSRAGAMAEAYAAVGEDVYSLYYNPAGLTALTRTEMGGAHTSHFQGINYEFAGFAYPFGREEKSSRHVLGLALYNLSISDIERRTGDTQAPLGTFGAGDYSYNLTYAHRLSPRLSAGVTGKLIHQTIDSYSSTAFALDAGVRYRPKPEAEKPWSFAAVLKNVGTRPSYTSGVSDPLPLGLTLGTGYQIIPKRLKAEVDLTRFRDTDFFVAAGGEYTHAFQDNLAGNLRFGYSSHRKDNEGLTGLTLGMGVNFHRAAFDFAWVPFGVLGDTFRYSLVLKF